MPLFPHLGLGQAVTQEEEDDDKYNGELQLKQLVDSTEHVRQLGSQVLHILLSEASPNSLLFVQASAQALVTLFPHLGEGHAATQVLPLRNSGALQLVHVVAEPVQVAQLGLQDLQVQSEESLYFPFPQLVTQLVSRRNRGSEHAVQVVAVPEHSVQGEVHTLQVLSLASPNCPAPQLTVQVFTEK